MPSSKKRKLIDPDWVDKYIVSQIPLNAIGESKLLADAIQKLRQRKDEIPSLAASKLEHDDVYEIFGLKEEEGVSFTPDQDDMFAIPPELETIFNKFKSILGEGHKKNEALARCFINLVIFSCILEERTVIKNSKKVPASTPSSLVMPTPTTPAKPDSGIPILSSTEILNPVPVGVYFETELKQKVIYKGELVWLSGLADYTLEYQQQGTGSGCLVVVEAKKRYKIGDSYGQLLSYMAMIHKARKEDEKKNIVIYGAATDGFEYRFWRINNKSAVSASKSYDWSYPSERQEIYSIFRTIIRAAILSSPTTSPAKGDDFAQNFSNDRHSKFDFGTMSKWEDIFTTEDDPNVEFIEMESP